LALLLQQRDGKKTDQALKRLQRAREALGEGADPWLQANADFGALSMTVIALGSRPWLLLKVPALFRKYRQSIEVLRNRTADEASVALHESLFHLYVGRLRLALFGWLGFWCPRFLASWILQPFNTSRHAIDGTKDIHLHSRVDVLAYRAVALARLGFCAEAMADLLEIERLVGILKDEARTEHWRVQRGEIEERCGHKTEAHGQEGRPKTRRERLP
jgi:hypothetical protein